jgi:hypothetical protein
MWDAKLIAQNLALLGYLILITALTQVVVTDQVLLDVPPKATTNHD